MNLTPEQIQSNWETFLSNIETYISGERGALLKQFYVEREEGLILYPASHKSSFHNAIPGGYVDHVNRVVEGAIKTYELWKDMGCDITSFTMEELVFSAINHDLGKIGDRDNLMYLQQTDQWRQKNLGEFYKHNPEVGFMSIPDRSLWLLQDFGIKVTMNEYIAIQTHDGLFDEANKKYFISYIPESKPRTSLPYILHHADMMAARIEFEMWSNAQGNNKQEKTESKPFNLNVKKQNSQNKAITKTAEKSAGNSNLLNILNDL